MAALEFKDISDLIAKWISILAAILGGFIWLNTYVDSKRDEISGRQQESIKFFREYNSPESLKLRQEFFDLKLVTRSEVDQKISSLRGDTNAALAQAEHLIRSTAMKIIIDQKRGFDMRRLIEMFDQVEACVDLNVCDREVIYRFFNADAYEIRYILMDFIDQIKLTRPGFGKGIDTLAYKPKD